MVSDAALDRDPFETAVTAGRADEVEVTSGIESMRKALDERSDVGCVVVGPDPADASVPEACRAVRERDRDRPVVVILDPESPEEISEATLAGGETYVRPAAADETLREAIDDAIGSYEYRRENAEESSMFSTLLDSFDFAIYVKDEEARHLRKSRASGDFSPEEFLGKTDVEVYGEAERESYEDDLRVIREGEPIVDKETSFEAPDGEHWARTTKVPWRNEDGDVKGLIGITRDVTEEVRLRKRLEEQQEHLERFVDYATHDLRNPLNVARGHLELARETGDQESFDNVASALDRIEDILGDLATLEHEGPMGDRSGDVSGFPPQTSITDVVEEVWEVVRSGGASLSIRLPEDAIINAPESSVRPVIENLLNNAVVHGGPDVTVWIGPLPNGGFYVADDGPGIPEPEREAVIEQGYTTAETGEGTGLAIVNDIVDRHDWELTITESRAGGARIELGNCLSVADPDPGVEPGEEVTITGSTDVGDVDIDGKAHFVEEGEYWDVAGAGQNIYGHTNEFHFAHASVEGAVRIEGRVGGIEDVGEWSTAGFMIRDDLDEDAAYGHIGSTTRHGMGVLWRSRRGEPGVSQHVGTGSAEDRWYRVDRIDGTVTTSYSIDGGTWRPLDQREIKLTDPVHVGMVVCSNRPGHLCSAAFDNVSIRRLHADSGD